FHHRDPVAHGLNVWAPVVNPLRDPRWGRNEEGYSEDPAHQVGVPRRAQADRLREHGGLAEPRHAVQRLQARAELGEAQSGHGGLPLVEHRHL
ncbi:hypothetical protein K7G98_39435, partial [Saccharothrix sp. MB29]|nr:hypothetical protein [Saccharothrix sp. MB29]